MTIGTKMASPTLVRRSLRAPPSYPPYNSKRKQKISLSQLLLFFVGVVGVLWFAIVLRSHAAITAHSRPAIAHQSHNRIETGDNAVAAFETVRARANRMLQHCQSLDDADLDKSTTQMVANETTASLPAFGFVDTMQALPSSTWEEKWNCQLPPTTECGETKFTTIFMAYNPDRLGKTFAQIKVHLEQWQDLVHEVVVVWNGLRHVDENDAGKQVLEYSKTHALRVVYPLKMGLPNDLMNRYHPDVVGVETKAILYYDDDGPFYSRPAIIGGFELWKRHASAQIGAMARQVDYSARQQQEHKQLLAGLSWRDREGPSAFVSHCAHDEVDYNFRYFANWNANMVLPSGSFLHSNYLCFLWHPIFADIRKFVQEHPVHPDDATVSMIVSQLSGRAPRVYSRQLNKPEAAEAMHRRLLLESDTIADGEFDADAIDKLQDGIVPLEERLRHRSLLFGIDWDKTAAMDNMKQHWADLRSEAVNALVRYFGSLNGGSIGWCEPDSEFYNEKESGWCRPVRAHQGQLPWMNPDGTVKATCP